MARYPNAYTESIFIDKQTLQKLKARYPEWNWGDKEEYASNIISKHADEREKMIACIDRVLGRETERAFDPTTLK